ncbi:tRNA pseudouridine(38-40) synthase TruA [Micrococcus sp. KBS0714]|uniref:tRNA pseudouridine(38-40) synthase TruA n=1 Tax=Micrococcus sp. KBS0714 TaxID=1179670 RepID=UPI00098F5BE4|nr:tRNA pseudouridine(38-40) synthase TruA [Micrococcus sp. KBS0714]QDW17889.1 tRNA pseudouridine(38-40) synthase TruA [Micrococcus sp. KBS0714]
MSEQHRPDAPTAPGEPPSVRVRLGLAYDGGTFHGWARQPGLDSVQGALEDGLERILRRPVRTVVAGRTDAGVHARGQVVHLDLTETEWAGLTRGRPGLEPATSLIRRLGGVLSGWGGAVVVHGARRAPAGFDARFSALWREYEYRIDDAPAARDPRTRGFTHWHGAALDDRLMALEADAVLGLHDFLSFCRPRAGATTIREVQHLEVRRDEDGVVRVRIRADAFCHNMVRAIVGALLQVGEGAREPGWLAHRVARPARDSEVRLAPPGGLTLLAVGYPDEAEELHRRAEGTRAKRTL